MKNNLTNNKEQRVLDDFDINLFALLDQTSDILYRAVELEIEKYKVSLNQVRVMVVILKSKDKRGVTLSDLSKLLVREPNSVTTIIQRMEKAKLVKKRRNIKENKIFITITPKGRDITLNKITPESIKTIVSVLTERQKQQLRSYLQRLREKGREVLGLDLKPPILR